MRTLQSVHFNQLLPVLVRNEECSFDVTTIRILPLSVEHFFVMFVVVQIHRTVESEQNYLWRLQRKKTTEKKSKLINFNGRSRECEREIDTFALVFAFKFPQIWFHSNLFFFVFFVQKSECVHDQCMCVCALFRCFFRAQISQSVPRWKVSNWNHVLLISFRRCLFTLLAQHHVRIRKPCIWCHRTSRLLCKF